MQKSNIFGDIELKELNVNPSEAGLGAFAVVPVEVLFLVTSFLSFENFAKLYILSKSFKHIINSEKFQGFINFIVKERMIELPGLVEPRNKLAFLITLEKRMSQISQVLSTANKSKGFFSKKPIDLLSGALCQRDILTILAIIKLNPKILDEAILEFRADVLESTWFNYYLSIAFVAIKPVSVLFLQLQLEYKYLMADQVKKPTKKNYLLGLVMWLVEQGHLPEFTVYYCTTNKIGERPKNRLAFKLIEFISSQEGQFQQEVKALILKVHLGYLKKAIQENNGKAIEEHYLSAQRIDKSSTDDYLIQLKGDKDFTCIRSATLTLEAIQSCTGTTKEETVTTNKVFSSRNN